MVMGARAVQGIAFALLISALWVPFHLADEAHDVSPGGKDHPSQDSSHESHASIDHDQPAALEATETSAAAGDASVAHAELPERSLPFRTWTPPVIAEATGPPTSHDSPPRPSRAPPVA